MYYSYVRDKNIDYFLYFLTLCRLYILNDKSEYDKLIVKFGIPQAIIKDFENGNLVIMRKKIQLLVRKIKSSRLENQTLDFQQSLDFVNEIVCDFNNKEDKKNVLLDIIGIIYRDIASDYTSCIFYQNHPKKEKLITPPTCIYDNMIGGYTTSKDFVLQDDGILDFSKDRIIIDPMWKRESIKILAKRLKSKSWKYDPFNHHAYKYSVIDIGYVYNGLHSSNIGKLYKKGIIENVTVIDTAKLYEYIYTDGSYWYSKKEEQAIVSTNMIKDIRFPLIFEIGRILNNLLV